MGSCRRGDNGERGRFGGRRLRQGIAVAERVRGGLGVLHHDASLVLGVGRGLESGIDGLHQRQVVQARFGDPADLQAFQDRRGITERLSTIRLEIVRRLESKTSEFGLLDGL